MIGLDKAATMRSNGVYLEADLNQYGQGLVSGKGNHQFDYGDKLDAYVHFRRRAGGNVEGIFRSMPTWNISLAIVRSLMGEPPSAV